MAASRMTYFFILFALTFNLFSQKTYVISSNSEPTIIRPTMGLLFFMEFTQNEISYKNKTLSITLPEKLTDREKAFGFLTFKGNEGSQLEGNVLVLMDGYKNYNTRVYIDRNYNLDLRDDGEPLVITHSSEAINVKLYNTKYPDAYYSTDLRYIQFQNERQEQMISAMNADQFPHTKGNTFIDPHFWLAESSNRFKIFHGEMDGDSVSFALVDTNNNGLYNEIGTDKFLVSEEGVFNDRGGKNNYVIGDSNPVSFLGRYFIIDEISPAGNFVKFIKSSENEYSSYHKDKVMEGKVIPDLEFMTLEDQKTTIHQELADEKYTLLDFWGTWCKGCLEQTKTLKKIDSLYADKIEIIGMNYEPNPGKAKEYIAKQNITWTQGIADDEMIKSLSVNSFPFYILVKNDKQIHSMGIRLADLEQLLKESSKSTGSKE